MGYLEGGSKILCESFVESIKRLGGKIYTSEPIIEAYIKKEKKVIKTSKRSDESDIFISTIPLPIVPNVIKDLESKYKKQYKSVKNIPVVCVIVKLKEGVTTNFWLNINDDRIKIPGLIEYTNLNKNTKDKIVYAPFYMPDNNPKYKKDDNYFINETKKYLNIINSDIDDSKINGIRVFRYRYAQPICEPEYLKHVPPIEVNKNVYVMDTSYYYPEDRSISESMRLAQEIVNKISKN